MMTLISCIKDILLDSLAIYHHVAGLREYIEESFVSSVNKISG